VADDLTTRLAAALDRAEAQARDGSSDDIPGTVLRLIERDRTLLADYAAAASRIPVRSVRQIGRSALQCKVEALRTEVGRAAADMLGVSVSTVGFWEQGQTAPNLERLHEWAQALGMVVRAYEAAEVYADV
jgi:DNA-binding XRE family transcriptional regulator